MKKNIVITISENHLDKLRSVSEMLRHEGLEINQVFEFGVITGSIDESDMGRLKAHEEVLAVVEDKEVDIGPPDAEIQ